jgi:hypothetical protein
VNLSVSAAAVRQQAEALLDQASRSSGASAVIPLSVAAAAFRDLQDGVRAAEAGSRLVRVRFCHALGQLFEELLGDFFSESGPADSASYFRLVLAEAEDLTPSDVRDQTLHDLIRYSRRFVDRAETGQWDHLSRWSSRAREDADSPTAQAGLQLLEGWIDVKNRKYKRAAREIEGALKALRPLAGTEPAAVHREKTGRLHYYAGIVLISDPKASMDTLQRAALHFHDARRDWDQAGGDAQPARKFLVITYDRLARDHTQNNPLLKEHFENLAFQFSMDLEPDLPEARVVQRPRRTGYFSWLPRLWR